MAYVDENTGAQAYNWDSGGIYQIEESDPVQGGVGGVANAQALELAKRSRNLHLRVKAIVEADFLGTIRGGVTADYNTLKKLYDYIASLDLSIVNLDELKTELRGNVAAAYDTMKEIVDYIDGLTYLPTFSGTSVLSGSTIDWRGTPELTKILNAAVEIDASNLIIGKTIGLEVNGAYALTFAAKFTKVSGSREYSQTRTNYIQMKCLNATPGTEKIIYQIAYYDI